MSKPTGATQHGPILSPIEAEFGSGDSPDVACVDNGLPGFPKGSARTADEVTLITGGKFGKVKHESE